MSLLNPAPGEAKAKRSQEKFFLLFPSTGSPPTYGEDVYVLGRDNPDLSIEYSYNEEDEQNVLDETTTYNTISAISVSVDPYKIRDNGDRLSDYLMALRYRLADGDDLRELKFAQVFTPATGTELVLVIDCVILYNSGGGDTASGLSSPFTIKLLKGTEQLNVTFAKDTYTFTGIQ